VSSLLIHFEPRVGSLRKETDSGELPQDGLTGDFVDRPEPRRLVYRDPELGQGLELFANPLNELSLIEYEPSLFH
jgi:hypothetical protein